MTRSVHNNEPHPADAKVLEDIRKYGWHTTGVFAEPDETGPEWAFSIGLFHSFGHSEVIVFGLQLDDCIAVVNDVGQAVKAGKRYEPGNEYLGILHDPYKCAFRIADPKYYPQYVGYALWFYERDPFPLQQCFWPDREGKFPWEPTCNESVKKAQPLLFIAGTASATQSLA